VVLLLFLRPIQEWTSVTTTMFISRHGRSILEYDENGDDDDDEDGDDDE
jgi:hypothetical protein